MISLGTIGEYIARIYDEVKGRPRYLIGQTIESSEALARTATAKRPVGAAN